MAIQTLGRGEPVQLAAGQNGSFSMPFNIAALSIDNFGEYFIFIQPSNRPGFWISPYEVKSIVNLSPPATSVSFTQQINGPNGVSGAISSGGVGTVNIILWDSFQPPQAGIISSPPIQFITNQFNQIDDGTIHTLLQPALGFTFNITRLKITGRVLEDAPGTDILLSKMQVIWFGSNFIWNQIISPESPSIVDSFDVGTALVVSPIILRAQVLTDLIGYYANGGPSVKLTVVYYIVHQ